MSHRPTRFGLTFRSKATLGRVLGLSSTSRDVLCKERFLSESDILGRLGAANEEDAQRKLRLRYSAYVKANPKDQLSKMLFQSSCYEILRQKEVELRLWATDLWF